MDIYVIRHGRAEEDRSRWPNDAQRPLSSEGEKEFRRTAALLGRLTERVGVSLSSPLTRAMQTAAILAEDAGWAEPSPSEALAPGTGPSEIVSALPFPGNESIAIVGHEPQMSAVVAHLLGAPIRIKLSPGSVAYLSADRLKPGEAILVWLLTPNIVRTL